MQQKIKKTKQREDKKIIGHCVDAFTIKLIKFFQK